MISVKISDPHEFTSGVVSAMSHKHGLPDDSDSMKNSVISENNNATSSLLEGSVGVLLPQSKINSAA